MWSQDVWSDAIKLAGSAAALGAILWKAGAYLLRLREGAIVRQMYESEHEQTIYWQETAAGHRAERDRYRADLSQCQADLSQCQDGQHPPGSG